MRQLLFTLLIISSFAAQGQELTYDDWKKESATNIRLLPAYGHRKKTDAQKIADMKFIKESLEAETSARKASEHMVRLGWNYFYKGDIRTAMYRFNQAWLLDSTNANAYWGFGAIYSYFMDEEKALEMYDSGLAIEPANASLLTDKGTIYFGRLYRNIDETNKQMALDLFNRSLTIEPRNQNTLFKLSALYLLLGDCDNAKKYYNDCEKFGGAPITEKYTKDLRKKCGKK
jgi:tetratricopeptide (TPR) repeat protein